MGEMDGFLDNVVNRHVEGWAFQEGVPCSTISLFIDDQFVTNEIARFYRQDLRDAGIGDGCHAFHILIPHRYFDNSEHVIDVRIGNKSLSNSPRSFTLAAKAQAHYQWAETLERCDQPRHHPPAEARPPLQSQHDTFDEGIGPLTEDDPVLEAIAGEFDRDFYLECYRDVREAGIDPVKHYVTNGWRQGRDPSPDFSTRYYLESNPDIREAGINPFWHFIVAGRSEGRQGKPGTDEIRKLIASHFDPVFYLQQYPDIAEAGIDPLEHYLTTGWQEGRDPTPYFCTLDYLENHPETRKEGVNPFWHYLMFNRTQEPMLKQGQGSVGMYEAIAAEFDAAYYLEENPDVAKAGIDPLEHFLSNGYQEGRNPSAYFDLRYYQKAHGIPSTLNPLLHYVQEGKARGYKTHPYRRRDGYCVHEDIRFFTAPGPLYESRAPDIAANKSPQAKAIAFYLPQFHPIPENDAWWGKGFTEWRNIGRGVPRFKGHYQPRIPGELGHYDLTVPGVMHRQVAMAKEAGLFGFCFYYYWFNGRRVLEKPLDAFLEDKTLDFSFSIIWANENWTRRWDGFDQDVLLKQEYRPEDELAFLTDVNRYFSDSRYIRIEGRPVFLVYRPGLIPDGKKTIARWRTLWKTEFQVEPYILMVQGFGDTDPALYGLDGAVEFPPHKIADGLPSLVDRLEIQDCHFSGHVYSYDAMIANARSVTSPSFPLIRGVTPSWDNDARRQGRGGTYHGSTPQKYEDWLRHSIDYAREYPFQGEPFVFINAWNEWAEAAYLEPDVHFGAAYLNATARALAHRRKRTEKEKVAVFTHDAYPHGAQLLVLHIAETLARQFGVETAIVVLGEGPLVERYRQIAPTYQVTPGDANLAEILDTLTAHGFRMALVNTSVSGRAIPHLKARGFSVVSMVHELPRLIKDYRLEDAVQAIADHADRIVFAAEQVRDGFLSIASDCAPAKCVIRPQGNYKPWVSKPEKSAELRKSLGLGAKDKLVINVGYADARKGFDIFQNVARLLCRRRKDVHFLWLGAAAAEIQNWLLEDVDDEAPEGGRFHMLPFTDDPVPVYEAADLFFLSSREDPFPTVVLEAMRAGLPIVGLQRGGGFVNLVAQHGKLVHRSDLEGIAEAIESLLYAPARQRKAAAQKRIATIVNDFRFDDYVFDLLKLLMPKLRTVSVVIPNYHYAAFLPARLDSIYRQYYPLYEVLALDDCSPDNSLEVLKQYRNDNKRMLEIVPNSKNSGSGYRQWDKGAQLARGEFVWVAEADDLAESAFLDEAMELLESTGAAFVFCDSSQKNENDQLLADSYRYYFDTLEKGAFDTSFVMPGEAFVRRFLSVKNIIMNVSGVLWRRSAFLAALNETRAQHETMRVASDWKMYAYAALHCGPVGFVAKSLNMHRRHSQSVTHSRNPEKHYEEIVAVQDYVAGKVKLDKVWRKQRDAYRKEVREYLGLECARNKSAKQEKPSTSQERSRAREEAVEISLVQINKKTGKTEKSRRLSRSLEKPLKVSS